MIKTGNIYKKRFCFPEKMQILEIIIILSILVGINLYFFNNKPAFININPHPFWIAIIPLSARYGFSVGFYSGILSGITFLGLVKLYIPGTSFINLFQPDYITLPVFFLFAGVVIGEIREIQKNQYLKLQVKYSTLVSKLNNLSKQFDILNKAKEELDTHIISQEQTLSSLYESAQSLKSLEEKNIYPSVIEMLKEHVHVESCSIYIFSNKKLVLKAYLDNAEKKTRPEIVETPSGLMAITIQQKKTVSINALISSDQFASYTDAIISSPIVNSSKDILGVLNIEKIPFIKFNPQSVNMSGLISEWCGLAIETARSYKKTKEKNISDDFTGAYNYKYFQKRVDEEFNRAKRYNLSLSILAFEVINFHSFSEKVQKDILIVFTMLFQNILRSIDLLFHGNDTATYFLILPNTSYTGAQTVKQKFLQEIELFNIKPYENSNESLSINVAEEEINITMKDSTELIENIYEKMVIDVNTGFFRYSHLIKRLKEEIERTHINNNFCVSALIFEIENFTIISDQFRKDILTLIKKLIHTTIDKTAQIFHDQDPSRYILLLPDICIAEARTIMEHIYHEIKLFDCTPDDNHKEHTINIAAVDIGHDIQNPQDLVRKAGQEMIVNGNTGVFTYNYLKKKIHQLKAMHIIEPPLIGITIRIDKFEKFTAEIKKDIMNVIQMTLHSKLDNANHLFHDRNPSKFILILPNTTIHQAKMNRIMISQEINALNLTPLQYKALKIKVKIVKING